MPLSPQQQARGGKGAWKVSETSCSGASVGPGTFLNVRVPFRTLVIASQGAVATPRVGVLVSPRKRLPLNCAASRFCEDRQ